jgi:hypothetical protein
VTWVRANGVRAMESRRREVAPPRGIVIGSSTSHFDPDESGA